MGQVNIDKLAYSIADDILKPKAKIKRKPGRPKKDPLKAEKEQETKEIREPEKEINMFASRVIPVEVRNAIEEKMEIYDKTIKSYEQEIDTLRDRIKGVERKYIVLANYISGSKGPSCEEAAAEEIGKE